MTTAVDRDPAWSTAAAAYAAIALALGGTCVSVVKLAVLIQIVFTRNGTRIHRTVLATETILRLTIADIIQPQAIRRQRQRQGGPCGLDIFLQPIIDQAVIHIQLVRVAVRVITHQVLDQAGATGVGHGAGGLDHRAHRTVLFNRHDRIGGTAGSVFLVVECIDQIQLAAVDIALVRLVCAIVVRITVYAAHQAGFGRQRKLQWTGTDCDVGCVGGHIDRLGHSIAADLRAVCNTVGGGSVSHIANELHQRRFDGPVGPVRQGIELRGNLGGIIASLQPEIGD